MCCPKIGPANLHFRFMKNCIHTSLLGSLTLSQPGGQIMPTLYWCLHQVLKATGAPAPNLIVVLIYSPRGVIRGKAAKHLPLANFETITVILYFCLAVTGAHRIYLLNQEKRAFAYKSW